MRKRLETYNSRYLKAIEAEAAPFFKKSTIITILSLVILILIGVPAISLGKTEIISSDICLVVLILTIVLFAILDFIALKLNNKGNEIERKGFWIRCYIGDNNLNSMEIAELDRILEDMDKGIYTTKVCQYMVTCGSVLLLEKTSDNYVEFVRVSDTKCIYCYETDDDEVAFDFDGTDYSFFSMDIELKKYPDGKREVMEFLKTYYPDLEVVEMTMDEYDNMMEKRSQEME